MHLLYKKTRMRISVKAQSHHGEAYKRVYYGMNHYLGPRHRRRMAFSRHNHNRKILPVVSWLGLTSAILLAATTAIRSAQSFQPSQYINLSQQPPPSIWTRRAVVRSVPSNSKKNFASSSDSRRTRTRTRTHRLTTTTTLASSPYGKFGRENQDNHDDEDDEEDDDDEEEEDDEYDDLDDKAVQDFRTRMSSLFDSSVKDDESIADELLQITAVGRGRASSSGFQQPQEWARPVTADTIRVGCILVANPQAFCSDFGNENKQQQQRRSSPSPQLLSKFGLTLPPPADLGADRRADLLPVLVVTEYDPQTTAARAVLLNRRTGYLLGDLEQPQSPSSPSSTPKPILEKFCIQPLWFGGVDTSTNSNSAGLDMLHQCPSVPGAQQITEDGLYWGGDPAQAQDALDNQQQLQQQQSQNRILTGFDFKFFVQATNFPPGELQRELDAATFFGCTVAKEILFKSRDRMGTRRAKPLWTEIMELLGGEYRQVRDRLYGVDDDEDDDAMPGDGGDFGLLQ